LAIPEKALGPGHPDVATALSSLAVDYHFQSYADEESLHWRVLAILEKALGPDHPDLAKTRSPSPAGQSDVATNRITGSKSVTHPSRALNHKEEPRV
jgi:hypothetical protein